MPRRNGLMIGAYHFTAQYQGTPGNREASVIPPSVWGWYDEVQPRYRRVAAFCDTAFKTPNGPTTA